MCVQLVAGLAPLKFACESHVCHFVLPERAVDGAFDTTEGYLSGESSMVSLQWIYSHFCNRKQELNMWKGKNVWNEWKMQILSSSAKLLISLSSVSAQLSCLVRPKKYLLFNMAKLKEKRGGCIYFFLTQLWLCDPHPSPHAFLYSSQWALRAFLFGENLRHWVLLEKDTIISSQILAVFRCE